MSVVSLHLCRVTALGQQRCSCDKTRFGTASAVSARRYCGSLRFPLSTQFHTQLVRHDLMRRSNLLRRRTRTTSALCRRCVTTPPNMGPYINVIIGSSLPRHCSRSQYHVKRHRRRTGMLALQRAQLALPPDSALLAQLSAAHSRWASVYAAANLGTAATDSQEIVPTEWYRMP